VEKQGKKNLDRFFRMKKMVKEMTRTMSPEEHGLEAKEKKIENEHYPESRES